MIPFFWPTNLVCFERLDLADKNPTPFGSRLTTNLVVIALPGASRVLPQESNRDKEVLDVIASLLCIDEGIWDGSGLEIRPDLRVYCGTRAVLFTEACFLGVWRNTIDLVLVVTQRLESMHDHFIRGVDKYIGGRWGGVDH